MKILVISLAGIGDTLFATPLIHELRANFPDATVDVLVKEKGARDLLENNPHLNRVFYKNLLRSGRFEALGFFRSLAKNRYDVSLNTHPQSRTIYRLAARIIGAPVRVSHEYECFNWLDRKLVNRILPQDYSRHCVENNLALLPLAGAAPRLPSHGYELFLTDADVAWAAGFVAEQKLSGRPRLGVHIGSGGTKNLAQRRWPVENYLELVRRLQTKEPRLAVLFFGGPEESAGHEKIRAAADGAKLFFPPTENLRQAAALIGRCDLFLSVDTALMHLAAAMKVRGQIVIETPTWNKPIEPYGNAFTLVKNPAVHGRNLEFYRYDGRDIKGTRDELIACMASIKIEDVFETVVKLI